MTDDSKCYLQHAEYMAVLQWGQPGTIVYGEGPLSNLLYEWKHGLLNA